MHLFIKNATFRQLTLNEWISGIGDTFFYLAFINYVSSYAFAPLAVFLITLSETIPQLLQFFGGVIADFQKNRMAKYTLISFVKIILYSVAALILMSTRFSLLSVVLICLINLISDTLGFFAGSLLTPIYTRLITDNMNQALGFRQATSALTRVLGNLGGGILLGFFDIAVITWFNVVTFLFAFLGILLIKGHLSALEIGLEMEKPLNVENFRQHLVESITYLLSLKTVMVLLWVVAILQAVLTMLPPISTLLLTAKPFLNLKTGEALAALVVISMTSLIIGSLLSRYVSLKMSLKSHMLLCLMAEMMIVLGFFSQQFFYILLGTMASAFMGGTLTPRLQEMILSLIPEKAIGSVQSAISLVTMILPSVLSLAGVAIASSLGIVTVAIALSVLLLIGFFLHLRLSTV